MGVSEAWGGYTWGSLSLGGLRRKRDCAQGSLRLGELYLGVSEPWGSILWGLRLGGLCLGVSEVWGFSEAWGAVLRGLRDLGSGDLTWGSLRLGGV